MREKAFALVKDAIVELNEVLEYDSLRDVSDDTPVFGGEEGIDSLSLVTLVTDLEQRSEAAFGRRLRLADPKAMSARNSPYRTAGSLADFIVERLGEHDA